MSFDSNTWYQISEANVAFGSVLTDWGDNVTGIQSWNSSQASQYWQVVISQNSVSTYLFRNKAAGPSTALGVALVPQEKDASRTQPRLQRLDLNDNGQKWTMGDFGNNTLYIVNAGNGSSYHLDVHPGNPVYMSSQTSAEPYDSRQHWEFQSIMPIDDWQWSQTAPPSSSRVSTTMISVSTVTLASASSGSSATGSPAGSQEGLPSRDYIGIGISVAAVVIILVATFILFVRRRQVGKENKRQKLGSSDQPLVSTSSHVTNAEDFSTQDGRLELPDEGGRNVEMPNSYRLPELTGEREQVELPDSARLRAVELHASNEDQR
ncbi:MAG: hypothetical protein M1820_006803 [Bogoriella megaspora]|nr:MAG: hypothetical protein M1820_006803 [Bogoriella megaspora]